LRRPDLGMLTFVPGLALKSVKLTLIVPSYNETLDFRAIVPIDKDWQSSLAVGAPLELEY